MTAQVPRQAWPGVVGGLVVLAGAAVLWGPALLHGRPGDPVARFLFSVAVILLVCHVFGAVLKRFGQPPVLGEVVGGLVLGPSVLGLLWPSSQGWLFPEPVLTALNHAAQLGLIVFMFLLGCELRTDRIGSRRVVGATVLGGMGLPFAAGAGVALAAPALGGGGTGFVLFFGLALSITALPVLARILVDLGLADTRLGATALSSAAVGDGVAWFGLTVILAGTGLSGTGDVATTAGLAVALVVATVLCVRPALRALVARVSSTQLLLGTLVVGAIGYAGVTSLIGLHPVIGAFLFGVAVPRNVPAVTRIGEQLQGFAIGILLPLFFAGVGLSTSVGLLGESAGNWLLFLLVLAVATVAKFVGTGGAACLAGLPVRESVRLGALMNCRGVTELVVATIGLQYGFVNELGFTILVLVAVLTTAATGPLVRAVTARGGDGSRDQAVTSDSP
ncbi:cation:proton antiporter [Actinophytocola glycyrrhizae]|uniref:Cation:proton antiporter n=1 Tax=Actinophytocola glycyrrhizae TaxID=2044873 RepID=A0ABV9RV28_9PSEU